MAFKHYSKHVYSIDVPLKVKLNGKILCPTNSVKYLGVKIDENLNWKQQISDITIKLNRENTILYKLRHFIDRKNVKQGQIKIPEKVKNGQNPKRLRLHISFISISKSINLSCSIRTPFMLFVICLGTRFEFN